jgi:hypothetical protein
MFAGVGYSDTPDSSDAGRKAAEQAMPMPRFTWQKSGGETAMCFMKNTHTWIKSYNDIMVGKHRNGENCIRLTECRQTVNGVR